MNKRDYLRSQGFNVGARGKFNDAMISALKNAEKSGILFDTTPTPKKQDVFVREEIKPTFKPQVRLRESRNLYGLTAGGDKVGFITCSDCKQHMAYCKCVDGVLAPSIVVRSNDRLVRVIGNTNR